MTWEQPTSRGRTIRLPDVTLCLSAPDGTEMTPRVPVDPEQSTCMPSITGTVGTLDVYSEGDLIRRIPIEEVCGQRRFFAWDSLTIDNGDQVTINLG